MGVGEKLKRVVKKSVLRVLTLLGYTVLRSDAHQRLISQLNDLVATKNQLSALAAQANALQTERDALLKKTVTGDDERDYQLLMAYQHLMASLGDLDPDFPPLME